MLVEQKIEPKDFEIHNHWYDKVLNATIHPIVKHFLNMSPDQIITRYCHLNPKASKEKLKALLQYKSKYFLWCGADLINVTSHTGKRQMVIIENNSCPSGQKSMPLINEYSEDTTYHQLIKNTFKSGIKNIRMKGVLAVIYDKNRMEASGYAFAIADVMDEKVYLIPFQSTDSNPKVKFEKGIMLIWVDDTWLKVRACFRYLTQKPWNRIPILSKTKIINPIISCLAGGRNKLIAAKAYQIFNSEISEFGLKINIPNTVWEVRKNEIPLWVKQMGGHAVIKVPYSNAGQGVYTIVTQRDLDEFMNKDFDYDMFIVQSLIGNSDWSSIFKNQKLYHVGTIPNKRNETYVCDIRMMISSTSKGIRPVCTYARRAKKPLPNEIDQVMNSWEILGTNLSYQEQGTWKTDTNRLILMDTKDFNSLGIGIDDLIDAFIQSSLSMIAIDKMCQTLISSKGTLKKKLFKSLNDDKNLINEIL
ncbi:hypothetical protein [Aquimarina mytili]|uniref:Uncharacterized protein n=1 Tax=Aquimarina mytili TaxID=874423 RepID=A0A937D849_9FLAO|nr:hypothetical protein [Aquimarina mytili]MBL0682362.1 hypothetical protein [Aquimarina mytili]